ncbi:GNAT family N-acetyltransferase [Streptomyces sp. SID3343]|uniref:GNAT family N-acetyltransferase n=1 Tax=Streptomyces sp. SID3343 TaxID=2690260 RepID=UPI00136F3920|nr:GNAT family N-acetyltransferase [Streptomyces sp. SID3343]MYV97862.1 GNAT family N-acetyltransferase [Streptomyces sp. SID3343]
MKEPNENQTPRVGRGLPPDTRRRAAELYWEAFGRKLGAALGPDAAGTAFIAEHLNEDRAIAATVAGELVGVAGYRYGGRAFTGGSARDVVRAYGKLRALPRIALLALLERTPSPRELVMDGIAVDAAQRGRGIGSLLLDEIAVVGAELGCTRVRLDVIDVNPRARALYERHGFVATRTEHTPYLRSLMGFGSATTMIRRIVPCAALGRG